MSRPLLLLLLVAGTAAARTPSVLAPEGVADREMLRLLSTHYDARARLQGPWTSRGEPGTRRDVCTDSGARPGDRLVAVCSTPGDGGPVRVDLFVMEPPATQRGRARIRSRFRGIERDASHAGDIGLMAIAPDRVGFLLGDATTAGGTVRATQSLYAERDDGLRRLLVVGTRVDNRARCAPGDGRAARRCRARSIALTCTLRADASRVVDGAWPLALQVSGVRHGEIVNRVVPIPHDAYGYRISSRVLQTQACDAAD
jgi:hypothetical protein